jgi:hypothetical protein
MRPLSRNVNNYSQPILGYPTGKESQRLRRGSRDDALRIYAKERF